MYERDILSESYSEVNSYIDAYMENFTTYIPLSIAATLAGPLEFGACVLKRP